MRPRTPPLLWSACVVALCAAGCGDPRGPVAEVSGKVTIDGKPVTAGTVLFVAEDGRRTGTAPLQADGTYLMPDAPIGPVKVAVQTLMFRDLAGAAPPRLPPGRTGSVPGGHDRCNVGKVYVAIPERYEYPETTPLRYTVGEGQHTHDVALTARPGRAEAP